MAPSATVGDRRVLGSDPVVVAGPEAGDLRDCADGQGQRSGVGVGWGAIVADFREHWHIYVSMPFIAAIIGYVTKLVAIRMIFRPKAPTRYLGIFTWQGLFIKRRDEVAADYGRLIADEIITPANLFEAVLRGPLSDRVFVMVQRQVQRAVDDRAGIAKPLVVFAVGSTRYQEMKRTVAERVMERLPAAMKSVEQYATDALDLRNTLQTKMRRLSDDEYENLLRPAFRQDEWILVTVGAVLGALVGELQAFLLVH